MRDGDKMKEQLMNELAEMRQQCFRLEETLRKSEERWQFALEGSGDGVWDRDIQTGKMFYSKRWKEMLGYEEHEIGDDRSEWVERIHPDDRQRVDREIEKHVRGETPQYAVEHRLRCKDGTYKWILSRGKVMARAEDCTLLRFVGTHTDITEQKLAEEQLRQARREWERIFQAIGHPAMILDRHHNIVLANRAMVSSAGKSKEELLGKKCYEIFHGMEYPPEGCPMEDMLDSGHIEIVEMEMGSLGGIYLVSCTPVLDDAGQLKSVIHIATDITERKRMEEELLKIEKLESIGVLAGGIAHDFNNILTVIIGNISLVGMYLESGEETEKTLKRLKDAEKASMRAKELTQQLLTFSSGGTPIVRIVNIGDLLRNSTTFVLRGTNARYEFSIADDLWPVEIDAGQIDQVIANLTINANQSMSDGGLIVVRGENVTIGADDPLMEEGQYVKISIEDQGSGIPVKLLRKIFDPYFSTKQNGSGLGLATSLSVIQKHNGYITVESQVGVGTTFHIYLPALPEEVLTVPGVILVEEKEAMAAEGKVLVMDDEKSIRDLVSEMLSSMGYEVTVAADGDETMEIYKAAMESGNPFDAVIVDLTISGGMGGKETVQRLIEIDPEVKAIVSSGYSNDPILANFRDYGFKGVVAKPYGTREMSEVLHRVITGVD